MTSSPSSTQPTFDQTDPKLLSAKTRILTHMTTDHADSLALYLRNYCRLPPSQIPLPPPPQTLQLTDIQPTHLIVTHPGGRNYIPITPPLTNINDARTKLIEMHNESLAALDLSPIKINKFVAPNKPWQYLLHFACFMTFSTFSLWPADAFLPEAHTFPSTFWSLGGLAPWNARLASHIKNYVLLATLVIHLGEASWFAKTRLRRYWVPRFGAVWWAWCGIVFLGGVAGITRFDEMARAEEREVERKKKVGQGDGKGKH